MNFSETRDVTATQGSAIKRPMWQPGSVPTDGAIRVGGNVKTPIKTRDVRPVYPAEAQAARVSGAVILELRISPEGSVEDASVIRSIPLLDQAAVDAVMQWRFTPTLLNGQPVPVIMTVTVNFVLDSGVTVSGGASAPAQRVVGAMEVAPGPQKRQLPALIREVKPVYPLEALNAGVEGSVEVEVTIDTEGKVVNPRVTLSSPMLDDAAVDAALQWRFKPPAQPVVTTIEFTFSTRRSGGRS